MKKSILTLAILSILPFVFLGCGTYCGDNPMGDTGGEGGYGLLNPANFMTGDGGGASEIYGIWRHDYNPGEFDLLYIEQNGNFMLYEYYDYQIDDYVTGSYTYTSSVINITIQGQGTQVCQYEFTGTTLTIHYNAGTIEYYRATAAR
jgi:hypothetical protein